MTKLNVWNLLLKTASEVKNINGSQAIITVDGKKFIAVCAEDGSVSVRPMSLDVRIDTVADSILSPMFELGDVVGMDTKSIHSFLTQGSNGEYHMQINH